MHVDTPKSTMSNDPLPYSYAPNLNVPRSVRAPFIVAKCLFLYVATRYFILLLHYDPMDELFVYQLLLTLLI